MRDASSKAFEQGYNPQAAVDGHSQVIIAADVSTDANDKNQIEPMVDKIEANLNMLPILLTADSGYFSSSNIEYLEAKTIDPYIDTRCIKHGDRQGPSFCGPIPDDVGTKERMELKLHTLKGQNIYSKRKEVVEPVFGQIKHVRGFRQFLLRGKEKVKGEWILICLTHNLLKLFGGGQLPLEA